MMMKDLQSFGDFCSIYSLFFFLASKNRRQHENALGQCCLNQSEEKESGVSLREMAAAQVKANPERRRLEEERQSAPDGQMISGGGAVSGPTDGGAASVEAEKTAKMKPQPSGEQMEGSSGSETTTGGR